MANFRTPGSMCTTQPGGTTTQGMSSHGTYAQPGSVNQEDGLTPEQQELALDIAQLTLDIVGIFEPTPFADGSNALISIARGDWLGAGLSGISMIPYIGDLAKAGKLPKYAQKLQRAIELAKTDPSFAKYLRPALEKIRDVLNTIPENLAPRVREMVDSIKKPIDEFLGRARRVVSQSDIDSLTDRLLMARLGSTKNVGGKRNNVEKVAEYFLKNRVLERLLKDGIESSPMLQVLRGIDITSPVKIARVNRDTVFVQYVDPKYGVGDWWVRAGSGSGALDVGLATGYRKTADGKKIVDKQGREIRFFRAKKQFEMLQSRSAGVVDTWSSQAVKPGGPRPVEVPRSQVVFDSSGKIDVSSGTAKYTPQATKKGSGGGQPKQGVMVGGGGEQYYLAPYDAAGNYNENVYEEFFEEFVPDGIAKKN